MNGNHKEFVSIRVNKITLLLLLIFALAQSMPGLAQSAKDSVYTTLQDAPSGAFDVQFSEGQCRFLSYRIASPYPGGPAMEKITDELRAHHWTPREFDMFRETRYVVPRKWKQWTNVKGGQVHTKEEQWESPEGTIIHFKFWYFSPDLNTLRVDARRCTADQLENIRHYVDCSHFTRVRANDPSYSATTWITKIEQTDGGYRVRFKFQNNGSNPVLLPAEGEVDGGFPHLRAGIQQEEQGEWSYVGNECPEHPPMSWITVKPNEIVESWTLAVGFPQPNMQYAMCLRKIGHLHGPLRISLSFFTSVCDIQEMSGKREPRQAISKPVEPLASQS